jgi:hypothetical protein
MWTQQISGMKTAAPGGTDVSYASAHKNLGMLRTG